MSDEITQAVGAPLERQVRPRLWVVRVVREAYVLADSEEAALESRDAIERWEDSPDVTVTQAGKQWVNGWDDDAERCLVYGSDVDLTLAEARRRYPGA